MEAKRHTHGQFNLQSKVTGDAMFSLMECRKHLMQWWAKAFDDKHL